MEPSQDLSTADWLSLLEMRRKAQSKAEQDRLAGYEHRAYAREAVSENPWMAARLLIATPAYQVAKATGLLGARSSPSLTQMGQGLLGIGEGLLTKFK